MDNGLEHPAHLWIRAGALTPEQTRETGMAPGQGAEHPLDMLSFSTAAQLLREEPDLLGVCLGMDPGDEPEH